jgi:hypothetical protein
LANSVIQTRQLSDVLIAVGNVEDGHADGHAGGKARVEVAQPAAHATSSPMNWADAAKNSQFAFSIHFLRRSDTIAMQSASQTLGGITNASTTDAAGSQTKFVSAALMM